MSTRTIVCLANSWKDSGRCVAGKLATANGYGGWIRPVSGRPGHEVSDDERRCEGGRILRLLDIVEIPVGDPAPSGHQTENIRLDPSRRWIRRGAVDWSALGSMLDQPESLWINGHASRGGINDRVKARDAVGLGWSLALIAPDEVHLEGTPERNRWRVRARFLYNGCEYRLSVTDPAVEHAMKIQARREFKMVDTYLCVSLSEEFVDRWCYKLAAAILSKRPL